MISCEELLDELGDYLDEDLAPGLRRELEEHLSGCRPCKVVADSAQSTIKIVSGCRSFELPAKLSAKIMKKVRAACSGTKGSGGKGP
jgi:anti-sigma factor (TIGR02949 family)